jgi:hypothetical protein
VLGYLLLSLELLATDHLLVEVHVDMPRNGFGLEGELLSFPVIPFLRFLRSVIEGEGFLVLECDCHRILLHLLAPSLVGRQDPLVKRLLNVSRHLLRMKLVLHQLIFLLLTFLHHLI